MNLKFNTMTIYAQKRLAMKWQELEERYKGEPIVNVMAEIQRKFGNEELDNLESLLSFENTLIPLRNKSFIKDLFVHKRLDAQLFYELVVHPWSYPSLLISNDEIETPKAFYWRTWLHPLDNKMKEFQNSVGRIYNLKLGKWGTCFLVDEDIVVTDLKNVGSYQNQEIKDDFQIDFSSCAPHPYLNIFHSIQFEKIDEGKGMAFIRINKKSDAEKQLPQPLSVDWDNIQKGDKLACIGYPSNFHPKRSLRNRIIFSDGLNLDKKNLALGVCDSEDVSQYNLSILPGSQGSPLINLENQKVIGMIQ